MVVISGMVTRTQTLVTSLSTSTTTQDLGNVIVSMGGFGGANSTGSAGGGQEPFEGVAVALRGDVGVLAFGILGVLVVL